MPRSKGQTSQTSSKDLGTQLSLLESGTLASGSMVTKPTGLITILQSLASQPVAVAVQVVQKDGKPVANLAISFNVPGDLVSFMSELWQSNLPNTSQGMSQKK